MGRPAGDTPGSFPPRGADGDLAERLAGTLADALPGGAFSGGAFPAGAASGSTPLSARPPRVSVPEGARYEARLYEGPAGRRPYRLYVPSGYRPGTPCPLIVMLHGCTQGADDFAVGTRMNEAAEARTALVAYPEQPARSHGLRCWNWYGDGTAEEVALLAGLTREVTDAFGVGHRGAFVAGLSAGGAMAAQLAAVHPGLFAGVGVHSGLAPDAASDLPSALSAMRGADAGHHRGAGRGAGRGARLPRLAVVHGEADATVHPSNGDALVAYWLGDRASVHVSESFAAGGGGALRRTYRDGAGRLLATHWSVRGLAHAWAGGSPDGSYTAPDAFDATAALLGFFLDT